MNYNTTIRQRLTKIKSPISKKFNLCHPILSLGFSLIVNMSCIIFVGWKSTECFIKYFDYPQGTRVEIKHSSHTTQFPTITICAVTTDVNSLGLRWNISHLNKCGIHGDDEYEIKWAGYGHDDTCTNPKLLWESVVVKLEEMVSDVKFSYYRKSNDEEYTVDQMQDIVSIIDTSNGRCYSIIPNSKMIKLGIRYIEFLFVSFSKIYIHTPGMYEYNADKKSGIENIEGKSDFYKVEHELLEMINDKREPCHEDPKYNKDNCVEGELEKSLMKEYGCTTPIFKKKENICTNETISKQVFEYWDTAKYYTNCSDPCKEMLVQANSISVKNITKHFSEVKLYFRPRVKVVKSYYAYSGLSLIAEIGGYFGLFLGVSINQITYLTSYVQEKVQKYF